MIFKYGRRFRFAPSIKLILIYFNIIDFTRKKYKKNVSEIQICTILSTCSIEHENPANSRIFSSDEILNILRCRLPLNFEFSDSLST